jgi:hypothetical protein
MSFVTEPSSLDSVPGLPTGLSVLEQAEWLHGSIRQSIDYARHMRRAWARRSSGLRILSFTVSASATIALGLAQTDLLGDIGFVLSALVTSINALESFFNWRSGWVSAEEALARWHTIADDLWLLVASRDPSDVKAADIERIYKQYRKAWNEWADGQISARRSSD